MIRTTKRNSREHQQESREKKKERRDRATSSDFTKRGKGVWSTELPRRDDRPHPRMDIARSIRADSVVLLNLVLISNFRHDLCVVKGLFGVMGITHMRKVTQKKAERDRVRSSVLGAPYRHSGGGITRTKVPFRHRWRKKGKRAPYVSSLTVFVENKDGADGRGALN